MNSQQPVSIPQEPHLTLAEKFVAQVRDQLVGSGIDVTAVGGVPLMRFENAYVTDATEKQIKGPADTEMEDCEIVVCQFADGSLVWLIETPDEQYVCLYGYYGGDFRQGIYIKPSATAT